MSDAGSQKAKRSQFLCLRHLLFHALALGDVVEEQETPDAFGGLADQRSDGNVQCERFALMVQALFINSGDLLRVAARCNFRGKLFWKQGAKLASNGILASHSEELLHARIPGFDDTFQIDGKNPDIQGLHDILAEVFEARDLECFLFE